MKKCAIILALIALLGCASCAGGKSVDVSQTQSAAVQPGTAAEWLDYLQANLPFDDHMAKSDNAAAVYGILDEDGYAGDCALLVSTMATPEEIAVFRADSVFTADDLTALALARLARQKESFTDYAPTEVPKLDSAVVKTLGDFVIVCVCADNAKAETLLNAYA